MRVTVGILEKRLEFESPFSCLWWIKVALDSRKRRFGMYMYLLGEGRESSLQESSNCLFLRFNFLLGLLLDVHYGHLYLGHTRIRLF